ncbi:hypothetical protein [Demequina sp. NBRC 110054]|uniref:hypothetical protein n=1 Tax=Demequina sp. NBRC 110054 TaxID=1570343 RepID=UPI001177D5DC|nr:hypothetical protein [Demequina sp. NBRC 110054]
MGLSDPGGTSASKVESYITAYVAEHERFPTIDEIRGGGVRARTATIAAVLRRARAAAARERALDATSPEAAEAITKVGHAMADAAQRVLDEQTTVLVEHLIAPAKAASDEVVAAAIAERDAARSELDEQIALRTAERQLLESQVALLREEAAALATQRDTALHERDAAILQRDEAVADARVAVAASENARAELSSAHASAVEAAHRAEVKFAEERGRRLAAEDRIAALEVKRRDTSG